MPAVTGVPSASRFAHGPRVIEEREREHRAAARVDRRESPLSNAIDEAEKAGLELRAGGKRTELVLVRRLAGGGSRRHLRDAEAILDPHAAVGEGIFAAAVVLLEPYEIHVRDAPQL